MGKASRKRQPPSPVVKGGDKDRLSFSPPSGKGIAFAHKAALHVLLIGLLGFIIYSNTFQSPFQWDESTFIVGNPIVSNLIYFKNPSMAEGLPVYDGFRSRYIGYLTFALNYRVHGFHVAGYHVVNLAIHLINAILVYFLVLLTFRTPYFGRQLSAISYKPLSAGSKQAEAIRGKSDLFALAVALLFVAHPIQTEAVTYVFQRFACLVSMFYLLSLIFYIKARLKSQSAEDNTQEAEAPSAVFFPKGPMPYALSSLLFAVLAMKTKENAFTLPVVITLCEFLFFTGPVRSRLLRLVPFLLTMLIIPLTIIGTTGTAGEIISQVKEPDFMSDQGLSGRDYLLTQLRVIVTYVRLLLVPVNQNLSYSYPLYHSLFDPPVFLSFLCLLSFLGAAMYLLCKTQRVKSKEQSVESSVPSALGALRLVAFGILWFFVTLSVESSIIPIPMVMDEYRIYLPSVGFFLALTAAGLLLLEGIRRKRPISGKIAAACFLGVILTLSSATFARNVLWKDTVSLWEDVVRKSPNSPRAYNNLGLAYANQGLHEKAIELYMKCLSLNPSYLLAYTNLGVSYAKTGRTDAAIETFMKGLALYPESAALYANLARAYGDAGRFDKAAENYSRAVSLAPYDGMAYHGLGTAYVLLGRLDDALAAYTKFVELSPDDAEAYRSRGIVYAKKGNVKAAMADFQVSCSLGSKESCESLQNRRVPANEKNTGS